jgi:hypothetical protein
VVGGVHGDVDLLTDLYLVGDGLVDQGRHPHDQPVGDAVRDARLHGGGKGEWEAVAEQQVQLCHRGGQLAELHRARPGVGQQR